MNDVRTYDWTAELANIASNVIGFLCKNLTVSFVIKLQGSRKV